MLATPHLLTGLIIGSMSPNPVIGFAGGVLSHLVTDAIPHLDSRSFRDASTRNEIWLSDVIVNTIDIGIVLAIAVYVTTHGVKPSVWFGGFGAVFPDMIEAPFFLFYREKYRWLHHLSSWHKKAHFDKAKFKQNRAWIHAGAWSQIFLMLFAWMYFRVEPITSQHVPNQARQDAPKVVLNEVPASFRGK